MKKIDKNDVIFTNYQGDISLCILKTVLYLPAEAHSGPSQVLRE